MPYPPEHRNRTRARIVRSAQILFNRHGFTGVSIDTLMSTAGLTRGGFYSYFETKSELYAEAVSGALAQTAWSRWNRGTHDFRARDAARQIIDAYLSPEHFGDVDDSCPMVTLPGDVARSGKVVKKAFEHVFQSMAGVFGEKLRRDGRADPQRALAMAGICVGGMVVARAVDSPRLADSIRAAAKKAALEMGGWKDGASSSRRKASLARRSRTPRKARLPRG
jgi:AcrR family transcriptional regulator